MWRHRLSAMSRSVLPGETKLAIRSALLRRTVT